ncbi:hypothetical protein GJ744_006846 [Endocarpon pusillum]|uniref:UV radiation resistance-associated gene protein n=1 Tax=Endocarpon pusillum TaxID=364733 RepID=A0A8H7ASI2_9EURO|nr:hypothetical protein GJ744_006846 [Endocarpon pusillum]
MSGDRGVVAGNPQGQQERPFFLPWNRRLRHLQGISVRNLSNVSTSSYRRGKTSTYEDIEYTSKSPTRLFIQSEARTVHQTRSCTDLNSPENEYKTFMQKSSSTLHDISAQGSRKLRRRSTLHWTGASSETRQRKLEDLARERMADAWYSLHVAGVPEPVYVSEVIERSINPAFRFFDLNINGPQVARANQVRLKLWVKTDKLEKYICLLDLRICFRALQFIGKSLDNFHQPLPPNSILFHFEDGIYTSFTDMSSHEQPIAPFLKRSAKTGVSRPDRTSSYHALMQLANLDDCIQDALATRAKLEEQINSLLSCNKEGLDILEERRKAQEALNAVRSATSAEQRQFGSLSKRRDEIVASLEMRRHAIQSGRFRQSKNKSTVRTLGTAVRDTKAQSRKTIDAASAQVRRVCEDLEFIYPLEPIKNRALHFSIRHLYLPNSVFDDTNRDEIAAALGFTSTLTHRLSLYLFTPLPYPILPNSSMSTVEDPVSIGLAQRTFPLYPTNVSYKFEYGVFLLNKDIEFLMNKNGLRILDIRHTLPNLKYLLYVLTAGTGELPARKAGGIRALGTGRLTPTLSKRGSEDSMYSSASSNIKLPEGQAARHGSPHQQVNGKEKAEPDMSARWFPSTSAKTHAYRNSSLREAF